MEENRVLSPAPMRYLSLDVLRGLTIALMIVVNNPGNWEAVHAPLEHSVWNGFTLTDLVFPTFLFVVGNALSFSMNRMSKLPTKDFLSKVFKRTLIIFAIGLFLNGFPFVHYENSELIFNNLTNIRIWGVLQRIAICYGLASILIYYFNKATVLIIGIMVLLAYWGAMYYFGTHPDPYTLEHNAANKLDLWYMNAKNMYNGYGIVFDPEGLLSTFPAIVNLIAGFFAGKFIQKNGNNLPTMLKLIGFGVLAILLAQLWNVVFQINKSIWTSSYVLYSTGFDLLLIGFLMWIIEISGFRKWTYFFQVFGKNPLFIYIVSWILISIIYLIRIDGVPFGSLIYQNLFSGWLSDKNASFAFAFSYMLLTWLIGYYLDKKKIYVKV